LLRHLPAHPAILPRLLTRAPIPQRGQRPIPPPTPPRARPPIPPPIHPLSPPPRPPPAHQARRPHLATCLRLLLAETAPTISRSRSLCLLIAAAQCPD